MNMIINMSTAAAHASTASAGDNSEGRLTKIKTRMAALGRAEAAGLGSRRDAGIALCADAYEGTIDERDAETCYDSYIVALGKTATAKHLTSVGDNVKSRTAQVSKFRTFIKMGMLPNIDGREVLARATAVAEEVAASGTKVLSPFEALRTVCVAQCAQEKEPLTDEQITTAVSKPEPADKDELAKLVAAYKAAYKLAEVIPMPETIEAVEVYARAIKAQDGEVPAMTKEEKEMAAFMSKARSMGVNFTIDTDH